MDWHSVKVLMWKHLAVRMRRYIHTVVEFLSPIVLVLIFTTSGVIDTPPDHVQSAATYRPTRNLKSADIKCIYYYPDTELTKTLMQEVGAKMQFKKINCGGSYDSGYCPVKNESFFNQLSDNLFVRDALVIFNDMSGDSWPKNLVYTLRMMGDFDTDLIFPKDGRLIPHYVFGTEYNLFTSIQWAIDTSFIKVRTGTDINLDIFSQEFPFYSWKNSGLFITNILIVLCQLSLLLVFVFLMSRLLNERSTGIQELMKMVGVSNGCLVFTHFLNVLPGGLLYAIVIPILITKAVALFETTAAGLILSFGLFLHFVSLVAAAFVCSFLVKSTQYVVSISVLAYGVMAYPMYWLRNYQIPGNWRLVTGLLPHVPLVWLIDELAALDGYGYIEISSIVKSHTSNSYSIIVSYVMVLVQILIFFILNWYLSLVRPGKYGQALPCNFLFKKQYWMKNEIRPKFDMDAEEETPIITDKRYFEEPPKNVEVGIKICNVSKVFPGQKALDNVSLDVYKGEITVLLGHNGAGKTTLMSIITGMMSATEGKVYVNGMETVSQQRDVRKHLGLCPQHNLFFPDLTVIEHVMFFTMLRGKSYSEAKVSSKALLEQLGIGDKANNRSSELSGGMMRRLQLACALAGDADVLILDEPTSGLDVETRRSLWDLLLNVCSSRTVLLSTHFMEEADALGHRAAALHHGKLRCHASTMYLKKAIGTGYRLSFTTIGLPNETAITTAITNFIPEVTLKEKSLNTLSYGLPATSCQKFPQLFLALESNRSKLGIDSIGVGVSTLEEVFLKLCSDVDTTFGDSNGDKNVNNDAAFEYTEPQNKKLTGFPLYFRQFVVLFKRQCYYLMSKKISFLLLQVLIPLVVIGVVTNSLNSDPETVTDYGAPMTLDLYSDIPDVRALYNVDKDGANFNTIIDAYPKITFEKNNDINNATLTYSKDDPTSYVKYVLGVDLNSTTATVHYTTTIRHAAPISVNVLTNLLASMYLPSSQGRSITTINKPISNRPFMERPPQLETKQLPVVIIWIFIVIFIILSTNVNAVSLPCKERLSGARHTHIMSGCPPSLYWSTTLLFHTLVCTVALIAPTLVMAAAIERDHTIDQPPFLLTMFLILELSVMSFFAFIYLVSFHFNETASGVFLSAVVIIFGIFTPLISVVFTILEVTKGATYYVMSILNYIIPPQTAIMAGVMASARAVNNAMCNVDEIYCKVVVEKPDIVVEDIDPTCYLCWNEFTPARYVLVLAVQFAVLMTLVVLSEHGYLNGWFDAIMNHAYKAPPVRPAPDLVRAEAAYVTQAITLPPNQIKDVLLADNLHKRYPKIIGKSCNAVKGISFSIKKGECFGLLGVNGAGKSTTFKMLTAEECVTRGNIFANGYHRNRDVGPYIRSLGYCPQFFGLDEFQTGAQNLALLLTLRGLDVVDVNNEVMSWIKIVGLEKYMHRRVSGYSGGCKRRLGAGAALAAGAPLTALDEPTAGVDVAARRRVWAALRRALHAQRAVLISSHSMDEMDALCSSIAIMSGGEVRALGSGAALRAAHASGHALLLKIKHNNSGDEVDSAKAEVDRLKGMLHQSFDCTLKDEHKTMLHYHINETMKYSDLFTQLEDLKNDFTGLVEDYSVTETTLEEVFLSFAKENQEPATV